LEGDIFMAEFANATTANVKMKIDMTAEGNIAQSGDTVSGSKNPTLKGIKAAATLAEAKTVFNAFYGTIAGATYDSLTAEKSIKTGVVD